MSFDLNKKGPAPRRVSSGTESPASRPRSASVSPSSSKISTPKLEPAEYEEKKKMFGELITGYTIIPKDQWGSIPDKSFIRYSKRDGSFVKGGYILYKTSDTPDGMITSFKLSTKKPPQKGSEYVAYLAEIDKIFKRPPDNYVIEHNLRNKQLTDIVAVINQLKSSGGKNDSDRISKIERDIQALQNKIDKICIKLNL
jgi:hypothetical protein